MSDLLDIFARRLLQLLMYLLNYPPNLCFSLAISCLYMGSWKLILISQSDFHASIYLDSLILSALMLMSLICSYVITTFTTKPLYVTTTYLRLHKSSNSSHNQFWFWCFFFSFKLWVVFLFTNFYYSVFIVCLTLYILCDAFFNDVHYLIHER